MVVSGAAPTRCSSVGSDCCSDLSSMAGVGLLLRGVRGEGGLQAANWAGGELGWGYGVSPAFW